MSDKSSTRAKHSVTKSGTMPRPVLEPEARREASMPQAIPELHDHERGPATGVLPLVMAEGTDTSAAREDDRAATY